MSGKSCNLWWGDYIMREPPNFHPRWPPELLVGVIYWHCVPCNGIHDTCIRDNPPSWFWPQRVWYYPEWDLGVLCPCEVQSFLQGISIMVLTTKNLLVKLPLEDVNTQQLWSKVVDFAKRRGLDFSSKIATGTSGWSDLLYLLTLQWDTWYI